MSQGVAIELLLVQVLGGVSGLAEVQAAGHAGLARCGSDDRADEWRRLFRPGGARGAATRGLAYSSAATWRATCKRLVAARAAGLRSQR